MRRRGGMHQQQQQQPEYVHLAEAPAPSAHAVRRGLPSLGDAVPLRHRLDADRRARLAALWLRDSMRLRPSYLVVSDSQVSAHAFLHGGGFRLVRKLAVAAQLLLALFEQQPCPRWAPLLELLVCGVHAAELALRLRIMGGKAFVADRWVSAKLVFLGATVCADLAVLASPRLAAWTDVFRVLRVYYAVEGSAQIRANFVFLMELLPRLVLGPLLLLAAYVLVFAFIGRTFLSFSPGFESSPLAVLTMFKTLTTVVFPSVAIPSMQRSPWYSSFFVAYMFFGICVLMNLVLGLVAYYYNQFSETDLSCRLQAQKDLVPLCFAIIASEHNGNAVVTKAEFADLLCRVFPGRHIHDDTLDPTFNLIDRSGLGVLTHEDFDGVVEVFRFLDDYLSRPPPSSSDRYPTLRSVLSSQTFRFAALVFEALNGVAVMVELFDDRRWAVASLCFSAFVACVYLAELLCKSLCLGRRGALLGEAALVLALLALLLLQLVRLDDSLRFLVLALRVILCMRRLLLALPHMQTLLSVVGHILPVFLINFASLFLIIYVYAVLGGVFYQGRLHRGEPLLRDTLYHDENFYHVNFNTFERCLFTMFHFMMVNDWHVTMSGLVAVAGSWSYAFFISFYFTVNATMLNVVVAHFVEIFSKQLDIIALSRTPVAEPLGTSLPSMAESPALRDPTRICSTSFLDWKLMNRYRYRQMWQNYQVSSRDPTQSPRSPSHSFSI